MKRPLCWAAVAVVAALTFAAAFPAAPAATCPVVPATTCPAAPGAPYPDPSASPAAPAASAPAAADALFLEKSLLFALVLAGAFVDARRRIIPDAVCAGVVCVHAGGIVAAAVFAGANPAPAVAASLVGALALGGGLLAFTLAYERARGRGEAVGGGDLKLFAALGFALGLERGMAVLLLACMLFALQAGAVSLRSRIAGRPAPRALPFCPAIAAGAYLVLLVG